MKELKPNKEYKQPLIPKPKMESPFEQVGNSFILKKPIQTQDYIKGKSGTKIDPNSNSDSQIPNAAKIFAQNSAPTKEYKEGDMWFDTDDDNHIYRANNILQWVSVKDGTIVSGATKVFRQDSIPTAENAGDIWFDSNDSDKQYVATSAGDDEITAGEWERVDVAVNPSLIDVLQTTNAPADASATAGADLATNVSNNVMTNISDAGALATEDTADFNTLVSGAEKPANNATVGATFGTNIAGGGTANTQTDNDGYTSLFRQDKFGDGSDGNVTISGNTTLTSDMYYNNLTVNSGITLNTGGYRVFVKDTLTNNGTIARNGNDGGDGTAGDAVSAGTGGALGSGLSTGAIYGGEPGETGANGVYRGTSEGGGITAGSAGTNGDDNTASFSSDGVAGGDGGAYGGTPGGSGGTKGTATQTIQPIRNYTFATLMREFSSDDTVKYIKSSAGSGSGGSGTVSNGGGGDIGSSGGGGGSGSTGGIVFVCAKTIDNNSGANIQANGGDGGDAGTSYSGGPSSGSGGGGAGSGGLIYLMYESLTDSGTVEALAGSGGTASSGYNGGGNGVNGSDGEAGVIIQNEC